jgi:hypothetical protein
MSAADGHPIMMCRLECPAYAVGPLDEWIPKHLDDSIAHVAVTGGANYEMIRDFARLPSALNEHGNRMVIYSTSDLAGCLEWLDSPELRGAIEDGVDRESQYPLLDGEPFIGNIYLPQDQYGSSEDDFIPGGPAYVERFEVPESAIGQFDEWLASYTERVAAWPGVVRARSWRQYVDAPDRFPYNRYRSKGNRMVSVEFTPGLDPYEIAGRPEFLAALQESVSTWDTVVPYARRDLARNLVVRP